jgi:hypothetical protein
MHSIQPVGCAIASVEVDYDPEAIGVWSVVDEITLKHGLYE